MYKNPISHKRAILIEGPPACGKGTLSKKICYFFPQFVPHSMGDMLRATKDPDIMKIISAGQLVPDYIVLNKFSLFMEKATDQVILDGFCRTKEQGMAVKNELMDFGYKISFLEIQVCDQTALNRSAKRGRDDHESFWKRLELYKKNRLSIFSSFYLLGGCSYHIIDGEKDADQVARKASAFILSDILKIDIGNYHEIHDGLARHFNISPL